MTRPGLRRFIVAAVAGATLACASTGTSDTTGGQPAPKRDRTVITSADMKELTVSNLLEVVQRLHPEWLGPRSGAIQVTPGSSGPDFGVQVYVDMQHAGNADVLGQLPVNSATSLKYYPPSEAQGRFGNGNLYGAIQVIMAAKR